MLRQVSVQAQKVIDLTNLSLNEHYIYQNEVFIPTKSNRLYFKIDYAELSDSLQKGIGFYDKYLAKKR